MRALTFQSICAHVVARLVLAPPRGNSGLTLEDRGRSAGELLSGQPIGRDLDAPQRFEQLFSDQRVSSLVPGTTRGLREPRPP